MDRHIIERELEQMLDVDVTLYVGEHTIVGSIGETAHKSVVVVHTETGVAYIRSDRVDGFITHPYTG